MGLSQVHAPQHNLSTPAYQTQFEFWIPDTSSHNEGYHGGKEGGLVKGKGGEDCRFRGSGDDRAVPLMPNPN